MNITIDHIDASIDSFPHNVKITLLRVVNPLILVTAFTAGDVVCGSGNLPSFWDEFLFGIFQKGHFS
jgi:hypothetical protein